MDRTPEKPASAIAPGRPAAAEYGGVVEGIQEPPFQVVMSTTVAQPRLESPNASDGQKRVNVIFSARQYDLLRDLAKKRGVNVSDILRQAINVMKLVVDADQDGKILIERKGKVQQLKLV